eukprot:TRINITY_DN50010_c0_g1_i1.p1 TRINITY_DN50010_c0_g1~~TRINITY_DN50010_c0_g1_i1.p1  ORF type:complete len:413 (+),score=73.62 TRINITY_DN50010_c0_g1_i1:26-1264(+)
MPQSLLAGSTWAAAGRAGRRHRCSQSHASVGTTAKSAKCAAASRTSPLPEVIHSKGWGEEELLALLERAQVTGPSESAEPEPWLEFFPGESNLILAAPHDGTCRPNELPRRTSGVMVRDTGTKGLVATMALEILRRGGRRPHVLICHLARNRLDVNRERSEAASHECSKRVWDRYHELLAWAREAAVVDAAYTALFIDVHAQANYRHTGRDVVELGTLCPSGEDLHLGPAHLEGMSTRAMMQAGVRAHQAADIPAQDEDHLIRELRGFFTMPRLAARAQLRQRKNLAELLLGAGALGTKLCQRGFEAVPSVALPMPLPAIASSSGTGRSPSQGRGSEDEGQEEGEGSGSGRGPFFSGAASYPLRVSKEFLDCLQVECPVRLSRNPEAWPALSQALLDAVSELWQEHHEVVPW